MKLSAIEQWKVVKDEWNAAFVEACETATSVCKEIKAGCGQSISPDDLLRALGYNAERIHQYSDWEGLTFEEGKYIAGCWFWWAKPQPVSDHWNGTISQVRASVAALREATPEKLHLIAAAKMTN